MDSQKTVVNITSGALLIFGRISTKGKDIQSKLSHLRQHPLARAVGMGVDPKLNLGRGDPQVTRCVTTPTA